MTLAKFNDPGGFRTHDLRIKSPVHHSDSLGQTLLHIVAGAPSNVRTRPETEALADAFRSFSRHPSDFLYLGRRPLARKRITASGIGESPASHLRMVRSSLKRTSAAKRRADKPDASIAFASRSRSLIKDHITDKPCFSHLSRGANDVRAAREFSEGRRLCVGRKANLKLQLCGIVNKEPNGVGATCRYEAVFSHLKPLFLAGRDCPDPSKLGPLPYGVKWVFQGVNSFCRPLALAGGGTK